MNGIQITAAVAGTLWFTGIIGALIWVAFHMTEDEDEVEPEPEVTETHQR